MDGRKRARTDAANGVGAKRPKETESFQPGIGSKSKPCTKFFSTAGCPFGEGCHFLHYVPGGVNVVAQMTSLPASNLPHATRKPVAPEAQTPAVKNKMCNKYNTPEGCKFGDKCHFAHGERELGRPYLPERPFGATPMQGRMGAPPPAANLGAAASFGASATAKISVDASLAGAIIGKAGVNSKNIRMVTGAKISIKDHDSDTNLKNIELEGSFDQIKQASAMVRELIVNASAGMPAAALKNLGGGKNQGGSVGPGGSNYKTKLCDNFTKGTCTFGDRCHFAHGASELRKSGVV